MSIEMHSKIEIIKKEIEKAKGQRIIVEGKKDREALAKLGLRNVTSLEGKPLFKVIESVKTRELLILTDFDKKGKELYGRLKAGLAKKGVKVNDKLRNLLLKTKLSHIEGLYNYLRRNS